MTARYAAPGAPPPATEPAGPTLTRRTALRAAAWSAPVIAMAMAVPTVAASGEQPELAIDFFEASWENLSNLQYLRCYFQVTNNWNNELAWDQQIDVTALSLHFDVDDTALADPLEQITLEFDDPNSDVGTWTFIGTSTPQAGTTRFSFTWSGTLTPNTQNKTTVLEWHTRAGAAVFDGSGFDTTVYATLTHPHTGATLDTHDTTGSV